MKSISSTILIFLVFALSSVSAAAEQKSVEMIYIPAGEFIMGSEGTDRTKMGGIIAVDEIPQQRVSLKAFYIDKYEVTNIRYKAYLDSLKVEGITAFSHYDDEGIPIPDRWSVEDYPEGEGYYPVVDVDWYMSNRYCQAQGKRLPTEAEWEKAARGTDGRLYPWGEDYQVGYSNNREHWEKLGRKVYNTVPVGTFEKDVSPYGVHDMAGNVLEWTSSLYRAYPGSTLERDIFKREVYVLRGGAYNSLLFEFGRTTSRHYRSPTDSRAAHADWHSDMNIGLRCARDATGDAK